MDVYKNYIFKSIFVWICIVLMFMGWVLTIIQTKNKNIISIMKKDTKNIIQKGISNIANTISKTNDKIGEVIGGVPELITIFKNYGGHILFISSWVALLAIEIFWRPYNILKNVDSKQLKNLINGC